MLISGETRLLRPRESNRSRLTTVNKEVSTEYCGCKRREPFKKLASLLGVNKRYSVCIKSIANNFFLTWLYVAARSHWARSWAGSVMGGPTFKMRQASITCERFFRLDRVFSGSLSSDLVQAQNSANVWTAVRYQILCWTGEIGDWGWAWFAKCSRMEACHKLLFLSGTSSSKMAERVWRTSHTLDGCRRQEPTTRCIACDLTVG